MTSISLGSRPPPRTSGRGDEGVDQAREAEIVLGSVLAPDEDLVGSSVPRQCGTDRLVSAFHPPVTTSVGVASSMSRLTWWPMEHPERRTFRLAAVLGPSGLGRHLRRTSRGGRFASSRTAVAHTALNHRRAEHAVADRSAGPRRPDVGVSLIALNYRLVGTARAGGVCTPRSSSVHTRRSCLVDVLWIQSVGSADSRPASGNIS